MSWNEGRQPRLCRTGFLMMWAFPMEEDLLRLLVLVREVGLSQSHKWSSVRLHWLEQCFLNQSFRLMRRVAQCLREGMLVADLGQRQLIFLCFLALCPLRSQDNPRLSIIVMITVTSRGFRGLAITFSGEWKSLLELPRRLWRIGMRGSGMGKQRPRL